MVEGLWVVQFEGMQGGGGGVVVLVRGRVLGGDSGYVYEGSYDVEGAKITGTVSVHNFLPGVPNVLGMVGDFKLRLEGEIDGAEINAKAALIEPPGVGIAVKLTRCAEL